jgi:transketolase
MRDKFSETIYKNIKLNKKIFVVAADISPSGKMAQFQKNNKNFINVGVSEQTMISMCAGLAMSGFKPFAYTIATFALYRPFEMVRDDICYQNLPVTIVGMGAGTIYANLGGTHTATEDISIARSIPNMQILSPCDPEELEECINFCCKKNKFPTYLRIGKSGEKNLTSNAIEKWEFGKIRKITNGNEICIISHGPIAEIAFEIKNKINKNISIYSCHTLKPFDEKAIKKIFKKYKIIVTIEDHSIIGGLSDIIKSKSFENKFKGKLILNSLKDQFKHVYSSQKDLLEAHGISSEIIIKKIKNLI